MRVFLVIGKQGSGKSTLIRALIHKIEGKVLVREGIFSIPEIQRLLDRKVLKTIFLECSNLEVKDILDSNLGNNLSFQYAECKGFDPNCQDTVIAENFIITNFNLLR
jgi:GTPase SAR1 family protein